LLRRIEIAAIGIGLATVAAEDAEPIIDHHLRGEGFDQVPGFVLVPEGECAGVSAGGAISAAKSGRNRPSARTNERRFAAWPLMERALNPFER
jgi:hypothetical protein